MVERAGQKRVSEAEEHPAKLGCGDNRVSLIATADAAALMHVSSNLTEVPYLIRFFSILPWTCPCGESSALAVNSGRFSIP